MQAPLSPQNPFEMLDGIGDIHVLALYVRFCESFVQDSPGRADEWVALPIFHVTGLFTNEDYTRLFRPFAKDALCRVFIQVAAFARASCLAQGVERTARGQQVLGGSRWSMDH
jgi:hypothetical protein